VLKIEKGEVVEWVVSQNESISSNSFQILNRSHVVSFDNLNAES
jgi:hypothetical protein